jgi:beta-lactamase class A
MIGPKAGRLKRCRSAAIVLIAITAVAFCITPLNAQTPQPPSLAQSRIDGMLRTGHADPAWFSSAFLAQVSATQVEGVIANLTPPLGAYQSVTATANPNRFVAHFAKGTVAVFIHFDDQGKIDGLLLRPAPASFDDAIKTLATFPGTVSYVVEQIGAPTKAALHDDMPLAVGSTFKLAVLNGLLDEIRKGSRHWSDVIPLDARWKSIPSGVLQSWPAGTPITLATYATEMISISDNTAADSLIHIVGAKAIAPYAGGNDPFLTTREMATLKSHAGAQLRGKYLTVDSVAGRASVLRQIDTLPAPSAEAFDLTPLPAIEWHYNVRQLCSLMERVASLPLMSVNPGVADPSDFARIAYKGGSDGGILNLTTAVTTHHGTRLCFSATVNATTAVDEAAFEVQYGAALRTLAGL